MQDPGLRLFKLVFSSTTKMVKQFTLTLEGKDAILLEGSYGFTTGAMLNQLKNVMERRDPDLRAFRIFLEAEVNAKIGSLVDEWADKLNASPYVEETKKKLVADKELTVAMKVRDRYLGRSYDNVFSKPAPPVCATAPATPAPSERSWASAPAAPPAAPFEDVVVNDYAPSAPAVFVPASRTFTKDTFKKWVEESYDKIKAAEDKEACVKDLVEALFG